LSHSQLGYPTFFPLSLLFPMTIFSLKIFQYITNKQERHYRVLKNRQIYIVCTKQKQINVLYQTYIWVENRLSLQRYDDVCLLFDGVLEIINRHHKIFQNVFARLLPNSKLLFVEYSCQKSIF
jgi:hypothetical protein